MCVCVCVVCVCVVCVCVCVCTLRKRKKVPTRYVQEVVNMISNRTRRVGLEYTGGGIEQDTLGLYYSGHKSNCLYVIYMHFTNPYAIDCMQTMSIR